MIQIDKALISLDVLEEGFVCDLNACKGACCVEGDAGAPLTEEEVVILRNEYPKFKEFLRPEGIASVEAQGTSVSDEHDGQPVTPLRDGKECAYTLFSEDGTAMCGIEKAWQAGKTTFRKPISCHLYPIRITMMKDLEALNYERWSICSAACTLGRSLKVPVYKFTKEALIRKYGEAWYDELEIAVDELHKMGHIR